MAGKEKKVNKRFSHMTLSIRSTFSMFAVLTGPYRGSLFFIINLPIIYEKNRLQFNLANHYRLQELYCRKA